METPGHELPEQAHPITIAFLNALELDSDLGQYSQQQLGDATSWVVHTTSDVTQQDVVHSITAGRMKYVPGMENEEEMA